MPSIEYIVPMQCWVYRSLRKDGCYVYVDSENRVNTLPMELQRQLAPLEFALSFDLHSGRRLSQENALEVLDNLIARGFHVQMPTDVESVLARIASETRPRQD